MARNILIFSDGTGQAGGLSPDQDVSNVYRLFRATRSDCESSVDARKQIAFYDAGLGTDPAGVGFFGRLRRRLNNLAQQALGIGIDQNIADCYAALIRYWTPGDRIYLIGFSRGAFTVLRGRAPSLLRHSNDRTRRRRSAPGPEIGGQDRHGGREDIPARFSAGLAGDRLKIGSRSKIWRTGETGESVSRQIRIEHDRGQV